MKRIVGICSDYDYKNNCYRINSNYVDIFNSLNIIPVILSPNMDPEDVFQVVDGILFSGGVDINPYCYGKEPNILLGEINPLRDDFEIKLCKLSIEKDIPILCICRGMQVLSTVMGDTLIQDINSECKNPIKHVQLAPKNFASHSIFLKKDTILYNIYKKDSIFVNSLHHQAAKITNENIVVSAKSSDGIIEAIEITNKKFALGVQWHPEHLENGKQIFSAFYKAIAKEE